MVLPADSKTSGTVTQHHAMNSSHAHCHSATIKTVIIIKHRSTNSELRSVLGRVYLRSGQIGKAEAHLAVMAVDASVLDPTKVLNAAFVASVHGLGHGRRDLAWARRGG